MTTTLTNTGRSFIRFQLMHMVRWNIEFYNLAAQLLAKHHHTFVDLLANRTLQHMEPILHHPHNVLLTMPYDMRCPNEPAHACFLVMRCGRNTLNGTCIRRCSNRHSQLGDDHAHRTWISTCH
jgi:hypothetical protein